MSFGDFSSVLEHVNSFLGTDIDPQTTDAIEVELEEYKIHIQCDDSKENVLVIADLGEVPTGRYRLDILKQALRSNGFPPPNIGTLGFSETTEHLVLFASYPLYAFTKEKMQRILEPFMLKVQLWTDSLASSIVPVVTKPEEGGSYTNQYKDTLENIPDSIPDKIPGLSDITDILGKLTK